MIITAPKYSTLWLQFKTGPVNQIDQMTLLGKPLVTLADPDFELKWGPSFGLLALPAFLPSVISSFFTQNKGVGGEAAPLGPSPRSPTGLTTLSMFAPCIITLQDPELGEGGGGLLGEPAFLPFAMFFFLFFNPK